MIVPDVTVNADGRRRGSRYCLRLSILGNRSYLGTGGSATP